jgi:hypothetical protein|tara:strand:+ start:71150 stop:71866 length:717 start_codon:yes stop_codon:yes gene_type:complete
MATLTYLYNENLHENIKTLVERHIDFSLTYSPKGVAQLTIDDAFRNVITEFCLEVYFPLDKQSLGFQIYGNGANYFHKPNEFMTDPQLASEVLAKAKKIEPSFPWHIKLALASEVKNPLLLESNKQREFYLEPTSNGFKVFYPKAIGGYSALVDNEQKAYQILINTRMSSSVGDQYAIKEHEKCAQSLWDLFGYSSFNSNDCLEECFLHFNSGASRFDVIDWFESYFKLSVTSDLITP